MGIFWYAHSVWKKKKESLAFLAVRENLAEHLQSTFEKRRNRSRIGKKDSSDTRKTHGAVGYCSAFGSYFCCRRNLRKIAPYLRKESLLMDFCSVKEAPLQKHDERLSGEVFSLSPSLWTKNILPGQPVVLCPDEEKPGFHNPLSFQEFRIVQMDAKNTISAWALFKDFNIFRKCVCRNYSKQCYFCGRTVKSFQPCLPFANGYYWADFGTQRITLRGEIVYGSEISRKTIADF